MLRFAQPWAWSLLLLLVGLWYASRRGRRPQPSLPWPDLALIESVGGVKPTLLERLPRTLPALALVLLVVALARPQRGTAVETTQSQGIDIMLCLDTSGSMQAEDLEPNRWEAARAVAKAFVRERSNDRLGLVVFGAVAFTQCPLTSDHRVLLELLDQAKVGMTHVDGTAIGTALVTCVNRLRKTDSKSKVILLVTDGRSNTGEVDPPTAASLAASHGIRIHTIGVGGHGPAPMTVRDPLGFARRVRVEEDLDEQGLTRIAQRTGGRYYRATDTQALAAVFSDINSLEKTVRPEKIPVVYRELYPWFLFPALGLLLLATLVDVLVLGEVP